MSGKVIPKGTRPLILPLAPLVEAVEAVRRDRPVVHAFRGDKRLADSYTAAIRRGHVTDALADRVCVAVLGCHPSAVYGQTWWDACAAAPALREDIAS